MSSSTTKTDYCPFKALISVCQRLRCRNRFRSGCGTRAIPPDLRLFMIVVITCTRMTAATVLWQAPSTYRYSLLSKPTERPDSVIVYHLEQVAADLKMRLVFSTPGIPRGRGRIERFFSTISDMLLCELPGFKSRADKVADRRYSLCLSWTGCSASSS